MPNDSPLAEAKADSLEELFARDPLKLSDQDLDRIIEVLRANRGRWAKAESEAKPRAARGSSSKRELNLDDLV